MWIIVTLNNTAIRTHIVYVRILTLRNLAIPTHRWYVNYSYIKKPCCTHPCIISNSFLHWWTLRYLPTDCAWFVFTLRNFAIPTHGLWVNAHYIKKLCDAHLHIVWTIAVLRNLALRTHRLYINHRYIKRPCHTHQYTICKPSLRHRPSSHPTIYHT